MPVTCDCLGEKASVAAVAASTTKMLGATVKAAVAASSGGNAAAVGQAVQLLQGMAETSVYCAEQTMLTSEQVVDSAAVQRRLGAELDMTVPVLVHLLALQRLPTGEGAEAAAGCCVLLSDALAKGLRHNMACVRSATLVVTVKLGQGLCTAGPSGSTLFAGCLSTCGGAVLQALLHNHVTETDVQSGVAFYLLACRAVQDAAHRTTLCSAIVPALIVLIGRGNGNKTANKQAKAVSALAGKLCLSLAKDATLAADFKLQVGRLTPELRTTLEQGLRAAMSGGASPAGTPRARAGSAGSNRSGGATPRRGTKPAIALKMDF
eukprot:COSAG02_NODE_1611_length_11677_cov_2.985662_9_plen_321_part_00